MVNSSVVVPVVVLAVIAVCMLAFIWWWFPRTWAKGQSMDMRDHAATLRRQRDLELAASQTATGEQTDIPGTEAGAQKIAPQVQSTYRPPVTPY
jgi:hypothetical protein